MAGNRIIYQSQTVFVGNSPATGAQTTITQLNRVQSVNYSFNLARTDVFQYGMLAPIDRVIVTPPTVNLEMTYNVANVRNEATLGFYVGGDQSTIKYIIDGTQDSKNYYIRLVPEGNDAVGYAGIDGGVIGVGNGFLTSWSTQGAVGGLPTTSIRVEGQNIKYDVVSSGITSPAVNPIDGAPLTGTLIIPMATSGSGVSALQPGQIRVDIGTAGLGLNDKCIQSYNIGVDLRREPQQCLGQKFPSIRLLTFPINVSVDIEANVIDLTTGNLATVLCNDQSYDLSVILYQPACTGLGPLAARYVVKGAKLDSQNMTSSIGPNSRATLRFSSALGGPQDTNRGLFIDGILT